MILDDVPMRLNQTIVLGRLPDAFRRRTVAVHETITRRFSARGFRMIGPIENALRSGSHGEPIPQADVAGAHVHRFIHATAAVPALKLGHPEGLAGGLRA